MRNTLLLVASGAVAIVTYGYFVVRGGRPDPRAVAHAGAIESLTDAIATACMHGETPAPLAEGIDDRIVVHAEGECGIERDPGSGIATTTIELAPIGETETHHDWTGDPASRRCAGAVTATCTGVQSRQADPNRARIVCVRRFANGWARVEAIVRLE